MDTIVVLKNEQTLKSESTSIHVCPVLFCNGHWLAVWRERRSYGSQLYRSIPTHASSLYCYYPCITHTKMQKEEGIDEYSFFSLSLL